MFAQVSADLKLGSGSGCVAVEHTHREALSEQVLQGNCSALEGWEQTSSLRAAPSLSLGSWSRVRGWACPAAFTTKAGLLNSFLKN